MFLAKIDVSFDEGELAVITDGEAFAREVIPLALAEVRDIWVDAVSGQMLPGMGREIDDDIYADALRDPGALIYPDENTLTGAVSPIQGDGYEYAVKLEKGRTPRNMKPALLAGPKARQGKRGRYNVIPLKPKNEPDVVFRTVSDRSRQDSWIYPGVPPANVVDAVATASEQRIKEVIDRALAEWVR